MEKARRRYRQGKCKYLLDVENKTARITQGSRIGRRRTYRIPDHVMVDGEKYTIDGVELGAFDSAKRLRKLTIPDNITFFGEDNLYFSHTLRSIYVGKGLVHMTSWTFGGFDRLQSFAIAKDNPHLEFVDGVVYTKDGRTALASLIKPRHITLKEGTEEVLATAFWCNPRLKTIQFPSTLKKTGDNGFSGCPKLKRIELPEGFERLVNQCFQECSGLEEVVLPSTIIYFENESFYECMSLRKMIIRTNKVLPVSRCRGYYPAEYRYQMTLYVPAPLVEAYKIHPFWGKCKAIKALEETNEDDTKKY